MSNNHSSIQYFLDKTGVAVSFICVLHCLFLPILLIASPALGATFLGEEAFHRALLLLIIPSSVIAFFLGCRRHKDNAVIGLAITGLLCLIVAAIFGHDYGERFEHILALLGSVVLIAAHVRNYRLCRHADCQHDCDHH